MPGRKSSPWTGRLAGIVSPVTLELVDGVYLIGGDPENLSPSALDRALAVALPRSDPPPPLAGGHPDLAVVVAEQFNNVEVSVSWEVSDGQPMTPSHTLEQIGTVEVESSSPLFLMSLDMLPPAAQLTDKGGRWFIRVCTVHGEQRQPRLEHHLLQIWQPVRER